MLKALLIGLSFSTQAVDTHAAWSPSGDWIAFDSNRTGQFHVYVVSRDGTGLRRVTPEGADHSHPSWAPDGQRLAFESDRSGRFQIWIIDLDGRNLRQVTNEPGEALLASWSPTGERLAYEARDEGGSDVAVVPVDGSGAVRLTTSPAYDGVPRWSPRSAQVAFDTDRTGKREVWVVDADGRGPAAPLLIADDWVHVAAWHPNGRILAATVRSETDPGDLYAFHLATGERSVLSAEAGWEGAASWSPDGRSIVFQRSASGAWGLYIFDRETGVTHRLAR